MGEQTPAAAMAPPRSGLWRDSRGVYVLGSLAATLVEALVLIVVVWPASAGWGGGADRGPSLLPGQHAANS